MANQVWIFASPAGVNALYRLPSGIFGTLAKAEAWINDKRLTGILVAYSIDRACVDWAFENATDEERKMLEQKMRDPNFIAEFSSNSQEHYFYEYGRRTT